MGISVPERKQSTRRASPRVVCYPNNVGKGSCAVIINYYVYFFIMNTSELFNLNKLVNNLFLVFSPTDSYVYSIYYVYFIWEFLVTHKDTKENFNKLSRRDIIQA